MPRLHPPALAALALAVVASLVWRAWDDAACRPPPPLVLACDAVVRGDGAPPAPAALVVADGVIQRVVALPASVVGGSVQEVAAAAATAAGVPPSSVRAFAGGALLSPGLVDTHVHANEPGRTHWEGTVAATAAAAAGGVTTVVDMPLNSRPAATSAALLAAKAVAVARARPSVDVGLWGGLVPANARDAGALSAMVAAGALGFKAFLSPSGIDDFGAASLADVEAALPVLGRLGAPLLVHAELVDAAPPPRPPPSSLNAWADARPPAMEVAAIDGLAGVLTRWLRGEGAGGVDRGGGGGVRVHVAHVASAAAAAALGAARSAGLPIQGETCPHYLGALAGAPRAAPALLKCAPPLRGCRGDGAAAACAPPDAAALAAALLNGTLALVASDHSPSDPPSKAGPFEGAWGGVAGLQYLLPAAWTALRAHGASPAQLAVWLSAAPADLAGLPAKGRLAPGAHADVVAWHPDRPADTRRAACRHAHASNVPYVGAGLAGRVLATWARGRVVFEEGGGGEAGAVGRVARARCGRVLLGRERVE